MGVGGASQLLACASTGGRTGGSRKTLECGKRVVEPSGRSDDAGPTKRVAPESVSLYFSLVFGLGAFLAFGVFSLAFFFLFSRFSSPFYHG